VKVETLDANGNPVSTVGEYEYDGDGRRVKKHVPARGEVTVFVYDAGGKLIGEFSTVAAPQSPTVSYTTADHLGSPRILTDQNGATISRRDFMPYGEEIARTAYGADTVRQKFTTYERDGETDLDYAQARMHNFNLGRFSSSDPLNASGRPTQPQSWNRYPYVLNNPLRLIDPTGTVDEGFVRYVHRDKIMISTGGNYEVRITATPPADPEKATRTYRDTATGETITYNVYEINISVTGGGGYFQPEATSQVARLDENGNPGVTVTTRNRADDGTELTTPEVTETENYSEVGTAETIIASTNGNDNTGVMSDPTDPDSFVKPIAYRAKVNVNSTQGTVDFNIHRFNGYVTVEPASQPMPGPPQTTVSVQSGRPPVSDPTKRTIIFD